MRVWFMWFRLPSLFKTCKQKLVTKGLIVDQNFFKNATGKPLNPSAFNGCMMKRLTLISSLVKGLLNSKFNSSETHPYRLKTRSSLTIMLFAMNNPSKWLIKIFKMASELNSSKPTRVTTPEIKFRLCLALACMWKYFVFLFPTCN